MCYNNIDTAAGEESKLGADSGWVSPDESYHPDFEFEVGEVVLAKRYPTRLHLWWPFLIDAREALDEDLFYHGSWMGGHCDERDPEHEQPNRTFHFATTHYVAEDDCIPVRHEWKKGQVCHIRWGATGRDRWGEKDAEVRDRWRPQIRAAAGTRETHALREDAGHITPVTPDHYHRDAARDVWEASDNDVFFRYVPMSVTRSVENEDGTKAKISTVCASKNHRPRPLQSHGDDVLVGSVRWLCPRVSEARCKWRGARDRNPGRH